MDHKYFTVAEIARKFRRSPRTIRGWIARGCVTQRGRVHLQATKLGKAWGIHPDWIDVFEHRVRPVRRPDLDLE